MKKGCNYGLCKQCNKIHIHGMLGKHQSKKFKTALGLRRKGTKHTEAAKQLNREKHLGKVNPRKGKKDIDYYGIERAIKIAENNSLKHIGLQAKEKHPNWKGGISYLPYSSDFTCYLKTFVRERDNFICQECGKTEEQEGQVLRVHHIDYDKMNCSFYNLILLCKSCHSKTNYKRDDWMKHYRDRVVNMSQGDVI